MPAALAAGDQDLLAPAATGSGAVGGAFPLTLFALVHISRDYLAGGLVRDVPHQREPAQLPRRRPIRSRRRPRPAAKLETTPGTNRLLPREPSQPHKATICVAVGPRSRRFLGEQNGGYARDLPLGNGCAL